MRTLAILATLPSLFLLSHAYEIKPCSPETITYMPDSCATCEPMTWYSTGPLVWNWDHIVRGCFQRETYGYRCVYVGADYKIPKQWFTFRGNVNKGYDEVKEPKVRECFYDKYGQKLESVDVGQNTIRHSDSECSNNALKNDLCVKDAKRLDEERHLEQWYYRPLGGVHETPACKRCPVQTNSQTVDVSIANNTLTCDYSIGGPTGRGIRCQYDAVTGVRTYSDTYDVPAFSGFKQEPFCNFTMSDRGTLACEERLIKEAEEKAAAAARREAAKTAKAQADAKEARGKLERGCAKCVADLRNQLAPPDTSSLLLNFTSCRPPTTLDLQACPALLSKGLDNTRDAHCQVCKDLSLYNLIEGESKLTPFYRTFCQGKQFLTGFQCRYPASTIETVRAEGCLRCTSADHPSSFRVPVTNESVWYPYHWLQPRSWQFTCPKDSKNVLKCPVSQKTEDGSKEGGLPSPDGSVKV